MAIRVGRWDCFVCGHVGNVGTETHCKNCGSSRPKDVKFYLPDDAKILTDKQKIKEAKAGADWVCSYCNGHNKAFHTVCQTCGNDRAVDEDKKLAEKEYTLDEVPEIGSRGIERVTPKAEKPKGAAGFWKYILGATGLGSVFYWLFSFSTAIDVPVVDLYWEREVAVEEYKQVREENWSLPSDATAIEQFRDVFEYKEEITGYETKTVTERQKVGTRRVSCGQKDLGNGTFEEKFCDEPVYENIQVQKEVPIIVKTPIYKTKYRYNTMKWTAAPPLKASGRSNPANWPKDRQEMVDNPDNFRKGKQKEIYHFWITYKDEKIEHKTKSYMFFKDLQVGDKMKAYKSTIFGTYKGLEVEGVQ